MSVHRKKTLAEAAQNYRDNRRWVPLCLHGKDPQCMGQEWTKRTLVDAVPEFQETDNLGISLGAPSGDLVRLDADFPSIPAVSKLLFPTTLSFGRTSMPCSGRMFVSKGMENKNFILPKSVKNDSRLPLHGGKPSRVVLQILSSGTQTMAPPSIHPDSGEEIVWENDAPPAALDPAQLLGRAGIEAFLLVCQQFWPALGERNDAAMALSRVLLEALKHQPGSEEERKQLVDKLVVATAMAGGDGMVSRRGKKRARATTKKMKEGKPTTGMTKLVDLLGLPKDAIREFRRWLGLASPRESMPIIHVISGMSARAVDQTQDALIAAGASIFVRGDMLVEPIISPREDAYGRETTATVFAALTTNRMRYLLNKHTAKFTRYDGRRNGDVEIDPPPLVLADLIKLRDWKFSRVAGIITAPTMRRDGSILSAPGYDPTTRLWCASDVALPDISEKPTTEQALAALQLLKDLLNGFKFVSETDHAVALAAILTAVLRGAFDFAPFILVTAHVPGEGKSFLVDLVACIVTGRNCPALTAHKNAEEMEKRLGALLLEGAPITSLDNLSFDIESDLLCQIATQQIIKTRILGKSEAPECEWRGTLFGTGNNVRIVGDMTRRTLRLQLDAGVERPELRKFNFDPRTQILVDRGAYIAAAITIARGWLAAGAPIESGAAPLGGFEGWSRAARWPLLWLGEADPVASMDLLREEDPKLTTARALVAHWVKFIGVGREVTANDIISIATGDMDSALDDAAAQGRPWEKSPELAAFKTLLIEQCGVKGEPDAVRLGRWLRKIHGRVYDGHRIVVESIRHTNAYTLRKA